MRVDAELVRRIGEELFRDAGLSDDDAATVVRVQLEADLTGMHSHGMRAVPTYLRRIELGIINPRPQVRITVDAPAAAAVDGDAGPGQVVAHHAMRICIEKARRAGVAYVVARRSNHFGAAGYYAKMAAWSGLIGIATTNGNLVLSPPGATGMLLGNNPVAFAFPEGQEPMVALDVATSVAAGGKVDLAAAEGIALPPGWAVDEAGQPTDDPRRAMAGRYLPLGAPAAAHKGFGLAFVLEVLAATLSGARQGTEHTVEVEDGPKPWDEGHFFLTIDPAQVTPLAEFTSRVDDLVRQTRATGRDSESPRAPGERAAERRRRAMADGLELPSSVYRSLRELARSRGTPTRLP